MNIPTVRKLPKSGVAGEVVYNEVDNNAYCWIPSSGWTLIRSEWGNEPIPPEAFSSSVKYIKSKPKMSITTRLLIAIVLLIASPFILGAAAILLTYAAAIAATVVGAIVVFVVGLIPVGLVLIPIFLICWLLSTVIERKK